MIDTIKFMLSVILIISIIIFTFVGLIIGVQCGIYSFMEKQDKVMCTLKVDGKEVYKGRAFYVDIDSIGENGNTKEVTIYHDTFHFHPVKHYVSDRVEMKS